MLPLTIVIVDDNPIRRIIIHALATRPIHIIVTLQHNRARVTRARTRRSTLINVSSRRTRRPTYLDLVLRTRRRLRGIVAAADTAAEEEVVVAAILVHERALGRVRPRWVILHVVASRARGTERWVLHGDLVDVAPEGAEGEEVR